MVELTFRNTAQTKIDELSIIQIVIQIFINHDVDIDPPQKKKEEDVDIDLWPTLLEIDT